MLIYSVIYYVLKRKSVILTCLLLLSMAAKAQQEPYPP